MTWFDADLVYPEKPGWYDIEDADNNVYAAYWNGECWVIFPQMWYQKTPD